MMTVMSLFSFPHESEEWVYCFLKKDIVCVCVSVCVRVCERENVEESVCVCIYVYKCE